MTRKRRKAPKLYSGIGQQIDATVRAAEITAERQARRALEQARATGKLPIKSPPPPPPLPIGRTDFNQNLPVTDELIARLERRYGAMIRQAESDRLRHELQGRWSHKNEGTPETHEKFNAVPSRRRDWPLARMARLGTITADELAAAHEIASVVEMIERQGSVSAASIEARVDCSSSARDQLVESLGRIRLEVAYRGWRMAIPEPKRMIIDMLTVNVAYVELARVHRMHWRTARKLLLRALRIWPEFKILARHHVGRDDVNQAYARLGEGVLLAPRPKVEPVASIAEDEAR